MSKYIDADKLIAEIEKWRDKAKENYNKSTYSMGRCDALAEFRNHIISLQQDQPNKYETALEKAREWMPNVNQGGHAILIDIFPELGEGLDPRYGSSKQEQSEMGLKEEITRWLSDGDITDTRFDDYDDSDIERTARHFAEWGATHLNARKEK